MADLTIGALARRAGTTTRALRLYDDQAYEAAADLAEDEDRDLLLTDLSTIPGVTLPS